MGTHIFMGGWKGIKLKFGDKAFYRESGQGDKKRAEERANYLRKEGYKVRIVKEAKGLHRFKIYTNPICILHKTVTL